MCRKWGKPNNEISPHPPDDDQLVTLIVEPLAGMIRGSSRFL
jgi:hypothetical protein